MRAALCLMPEAEVQQRLDHAIAGYARAHGRSPFTAHITLVASADPARLDLAAAQRVAARHAPLTLSRAGVLRTDAFTRAYALQFAPDAALLRLRDDAVRTAGVADSASFIPHISLTYGIPPPDLAALDAVDAAFAGPIRFDALVVDSHPAVFAAQSDVARVSSSTRIPLTGS
jgi:2'-5' RNA ligase